MTQTYFPFDSGAGSSVTEAQWRKMAKLWLSDGVIRGDLNGLAVSQRGAGANKSVDVASGRAWVDGHFYESDATENLVIADNASGNPRIDRIVVRVDFVANTVALAVIQGTPAATPAAPALTQSSSVWEIPLAQVAVANGFASILTANITDERQYAAGRADWQHVPATVSYVSADGHTFVASTGGVDLTGIIPVGARFRCVQVAGVFYGIVTAVSATQLTLYGGTDYTLANAACSSPEFSIAKVPRGFNPNPAKWAETLSNTADQSVSTPTNGTWVNPGSLSLAVPIGAWGLSYSAALYVEASGQADLRGQVTLSTANNSESDSDFTSGQEINGPTTLARMASAHTRSKHVVLAAKTTYYLNARVTVAAMSALALAGSQATTRIVATCAYL